MGHNPRFSVIVPAYNVDSYVGAAIKSVLAQTYEDFELIVIDDGSTDLTLRAIERSCQGDRRCAVLHTDNSGVSAARNRGLDVCKGDYIYFLDGDDTLPLHALEYIDRSIGDEYPDVVVTKVAVSVDSYPEIDGYIKTPEFVSDDLSTYGPIACGFPTYLFLFAISRNQIGGVRFDEALSVQEDSDFLLRALSGAQSYAQCTEATYLYRSGRSGSALSSLDIRGCLSIKEARKRILLSTDAAAPGYKADTEFASACFGVLRRVARNKEVYLHEAVLDSEVLSKIENSPHVKTAFVRAAARLPLLMRPVFVLLGVLFK